MREAVVARYFPWAADRLLEAIIRTEEATPESAAAEDAADYGRSPAFRRNILDIYDHQCAACGLRIRLPAGANVSFIDAAHLLPWDRYRNDHPTNGLALCKNHHWAMDRHIIAPAPDHRWQVSQVIDPRRSNGEKDLSELSGKSLLLPKDPAFYPNAEGLEWRVRSLVA
jgi:putative restriction endonuclease